jgi:hypothetical protein
MRKTMQMPVTIGLFVPPGERPAPTKGTAAPLNRDFEYAVSSDSDARLSLHVTPSDEKRPTTVGACGS